MACLDCEKSNLVPVCTTNLTLGVITDTDTDVDIYVRNVTLNQLHIFEVDANDVQIASDANGYVVLPMSTKNIWNPSHYYEVWITKTSATHIEDRETISIGQVDTDCINLNLTYVTNQDSESENYSSLTLSIS